MPQKKHCVLSATANERPPTLHVVALVKNPSQVFHSYLQRMRRNWPTPLRCLWWCGRSRTSKFPTGTKAPSGRRSQQFGKLAAVKNALSEVLHLKDSVVRASAQGSIQMRVNHFPDYYMMVTLLDDGDYPTFNRPQHVS